ncbi:hypothetical protein [Cerasicoccus arenae]|uniref:Uncharacterized protein n=1 Tax=Cerasicoccus arenae TaxID=424488 RepID=A0A8J3D9F5_9BACT|nr:hypothetical protein [Cerasicoccus arenae]MBK1857179.1 hypothetical protein [Cerasicoccus arenae]GHB92809.1 hypothetical protein GCM10007047_05100 [Cerasicoccus arenae]
MAVSRDLLGARTLSVEGRWCLHSYYSLCPYAPDGSGRILIAGVDLENGQGEVMILSPDAKVLDRFGRNDVTPSFWHTGFWQSWSPDARFVYFQSGDEMNPQVIRRELSTGIEVQVSGDLEGIPPSGEPGLSCLHGLLYAAGYGHPERLYRPELATVPFQARDKHGISSLDFKKATTSLLLSTNGILEIHPDRDRLHREDHIIRERLGPDEGLTLMTYCVRWNRQGTRCLFYFGNHCVDKRRGEPKITYVFTADRNLQDIHLALDLSFGRPGVHWAWQPDGERLIGYGPRLDVPGKIALAEVRYDGTGYRILSDHASGGHPTVSPVNDDLIVTDEGTPEGGAVLFISRQSGKEITRVALPKFVGERELPGRNANRICHHPVFSQDGSRVLCNSLPGRFAQLFEMEPPQ